jgi:uncharacterized lipoprotein YddW (UPF0748 family)
MAQANMAVNGSGAAPARESGIRDGTLYKYVKFEGGKYGYDFNMPVKYNILANENVIIPGGSVPPKCQFRAIWLATILNMNLRETDSRADYQKEYFKILDTYEDWNMNVMIFQVSPLADAFWPSEHRPWSQFVTGKQGGDPGWDPLEWMIAETRKRGLEFHAWFNPYRVTFAPYTDATFAGRGTADIDAMSNAEVTALYKNSGVLAANNFAVLHPEYTYRFERKIYLDAGIPAVRKHIADTVKEVIARYDIDAVHFDDYFYPYGGTDAKMVLAEVNKDYYEKYPGTKAEREQWRRDNNTLMIAGVKEAVDSENKKNGKAVRFGVSPFGVWYKNPPDLRGSIAGGNSSFTYTDGVYADTLKWVKEGLVDYIIPQLYWSFDHAEAPYGELARWWSSVVEGTNVDLYIGHANYKHIKNGDIEPAWMNPDEILHQLKFNQQYPQIKGSVFFSYNNIIPSAESGAKFKVQNDSIEVLKEYCRRGEAGLTEVVL